MAVSYVGQWAAVKVARRVGKSIPVVGALVAVGFLAYSVRKKGVLRGIMDTALDAIPVVGALKNGIELLRGEDFIRDLPAAPPPPLTAPAPDPEVTSDTPS